MNARSNVTEGQRKQVLGISTVAFTAQGGDTWIDLIAERVVAARLNGRQLDVAGVVLTAG